MTAAAISGLASNLQLTVPLALVVLFGTLGPLSEWWAIPLRSVRPRTPAERERARRERAARRQSASPHKEMERSAS